MSIEISTGPSFGDPLDQFPLTVDGRHIAVGSKDVADAIDIIRKYAERIKLAGRGADL